jgi:hypothetical protein
VRALCARVAWRGARRVRSSARACCDPGGTWPPRSAVLRCSADARVSRGCCVRAGCQTLWCAPCAYGRMAESEKAPEGVWGKARARNARGTYALATHRERNNPNNRHGTTRPAAARAPPPRRRAAAPVPCAAMRAPAAAPPAARGCAAGTPHVPSRSRHHPTRERSVTPSHPTHMRSRPLPSCLSHPRTPLPSRLALPRSVSQGNCVKGALIYSCLPHFTQAVAEYETRREHHIEGNCLVDVWNACAPQHAAAAAATWRACTIYECVSVPRRRCGSRCFLTVRAAWPLPRAV